MKYIQTIKILTLALILAGGLQYVMAAWSGPTATPPGDNASVPINVSSISQTKDGALWADGGFFSTLGGVFTGNGVWANQYCDEDGENCEAITDLSGGGGVPSGAVMFFDLTSCPTGWSEDNDVDGRYITGLPTGGTLGAQVGTALSDQENRPVGQHNHNVPGRAGSNAQPGSGYALNTRSGGANFGTYNAGSVAGTNAPYIQYLACKKD